MTTIKSSLAVHSFAGPCSLSEQQEKSTIECKFAHLRENYKYLQEHPEIKTFIKLLLHAVVLERPFEVRPFLCKYIDDNFKDIKKILERKGGPISKKGKPVSMAIFNKWKHSSIAKREASLCKDAEEEDDIPDFGVYSDVILDPKIIDSLMPNTSMEKICERRQTKIDKSKFSELLSEWLSTSEGNQEQFVEKKLRKSSFKDFNCYLAEMRDKGFLRKPPKLSKYEQELLMIRMTVLVGDIS
ncbi:unnamed protein product [Phyllotreta striolata]|uniref:Uncharacterized protein n=1 Tax=Phyllotreta striolata TaxID=444603 RepID=A0A9N9XPI2_PHYSR|nr:unnamed protein product [Phyllotreta striolata]